MILINSIQNIVESGAEQFLSWVTELLPKLFLFLILLNAVTSMIGRARVEKLAARCESNPVLRYLVLPFLSAVVLGNPMAISMGRYLPERYKPAYFASTSYHCHTNSGIFQHINPAELFLWLGIANGVMAQGHDLFPLAQFIKEDIYVSGVTNANISLADGSAAPAGEATAQEAAKDEKKEEKKGIDTSKKLSEQMAESGNGNVLAKIGLGAGKVVATFNQAARDAVQTVIGTLLPFMAFVSLLIGIINGTGFGTFFSTLLQPLLGNIFGLLILGVICAIPGLSAILGPGAVISQILGSIMGAEIAAGRISPSLALVGLFALNCHAACDFIPVGLGLAEAETETVEVGVVSVMYSRFITSWIRVLLAIVFSVGLYTAA